MSALLDLIKYLWVSTYLRETTIMLKDSYRLWNTIHDLDKILFLTSRETFKSKQWLSQSTSTQHISSTLSRRLKVNQRIYKYRLNRIQSFIVELKIFIRMKNSLACSPVIDGKHIRTNFTGSITSFDQCHFHTNDFESITSIVERCNFVIKGVEHRLCRLFWRSRC